MALTLSSLLSLSAAAEASPEGLRACTQRYASWINLCDTKLRRSSEAAGVDQSGGQWCASSPKVIEDLKRQLFAIDALCTDVTPEERQGLVKLVAPTLRSLKAASSCAPQVMAEVPARSSAPPAAIPNMQPPPAISAAPVPRSALSNPPPPQPPPQVRPEPARQEAQKPITPPARKVTTATVPAEATGAAAPKPPIKAETRTPMRAESPRLEASEPRLGASLPVAALPVADTVKVTPPAYQAVPAQGDCLIVRQVRPGSYVIDVSACASRPVHAAIDLYQPSRGSHCVRQVFDQNVEFGGTDMPAPQINFQCIAGSEGCSAEILAEMFPECQSG